MTGREEVDRLKSQLDEVFERAERVDRDTDTELKSDLARYLCVLVSGYVEQAVVAMVQEHARKNGVPTLIAFVEKNTRQIGSPKAERILDLLGSFDKGWKERAFRILRH